LDLILNGDEAPEPSPTDGLLEFYSVFSRFVESVTYKMRLSPEIKEAIDDYIRALEMLMWQKSVENMKFAQLLQSYEKYPMLFSPPQPPEPITPQVEPYTEGAANTG